MSRWKKFSEDLYREFDAPAVAAVLSHLEEQGVYARVGHDKYGVDIVVFSGFRPVAFIEVEVAATWTSEGSWPYEDVHVLRRKAKFLDGNLGLPCSLYRLSKDLTRAVVVQDHVLTGDMVELVSNRYAPEGEPMWVVPLDLVEEVRLFETSSSSPDDGSREIEL